MNKTLLVLFTKEYYKGAPFVDEFFFKNNMNFCFIKDLDKTHSNLHAIKDNDKDGKYLHKINESGILLVFDGWSSKEQKILNFDEMFRELSIAISSEIELYVWYHKNTFSTMHALWQKHCNHLKINGEDISSHTLSNQVPYRHVIDYSKNKTSLNQIIKQCYTIKKAHFRLEEEQSKLFIKLDSLKYEKGRIVKNKAYKQFLDEREQLITKYTKI